MSPFVFFWLLLKASLFSTGGMGNLPSLHHDMVPRGWATEGQFTEALAVGQISPGPTGLWVVSFGYFVDGVRGALLATLAIILPPLLVLLIAAVYGRVKDHPAIEGFVHGLSIGVIGISAVILTTMLRAIGIDLFTSAVVAITIALALTRRVPVPAILLLAGVAGALAR